MKISEVKDQNVESYLKITDFENFFDIYQDMSGRYFYNMNNNLYIDFDGDQLKEYILDHDSHWSLISYKLYSTTRLAWLLMKVNNVSAKDVFSLLRAGTKVKYPSKNNLRTIVEYINSYNDLAV